MIVGMAITNKIIPAISKNVLIIFCFRCLYIEIFVFLQRKICESLVRGNGHLGLEIFHFFWHLLRNRI